MRANCIPLIRDIQAQGPSQSRTWSPRGQGAPQRVMAPMTYSDLFRQEAHVQLERQDAAH
jgi:hypothetical protein